MSPRRRFQGAASPPGAEPQGPPAAPGPQQQLGDEAEEHFAPAEQKGAPAETPATGGDGESPEGRPPTARAKAKAKPGAEAPGETGENAKGTYKPCRDCKRMKNVPAEMSAKMSCCKECRGNEESCCRMAIRQGKGEWLEKVKAEEPQTYRKLLGTYKKCCPPDANNYNRRQGTFPLMQFISTLEVSGGKKAEKVFKMMWEREYYEEAAKTPMGNLTIEEAKRQWALWEADPKHPRDNNGPRNYLQLEVPMGAFHKHYQDRRRAVLRARVDRPSGPRLSFVSRRPDVKIHRNHVKSCRHAIS
jgi:hypothetical protein